MKTYVVVLCCMTFALVSCSKNSVRNPMMSDGRFAFDSLELVDATNEIIVTDPQALAAIRAIIETSPRMTKQSDEVEFDEMKKLRLINSDPEKSRIYLVDLRNGYATILSKSVMPVYKLSDIKKFNDIIKAQIGGDRGARDRAG